MKAILFAVTLTAVVVAVSWAAATVLTGHQARRFGSACHSSGGHVYDADSGLLCLTDDGRIIEVKR